MRTALLLTVLALAGCQSFLDGYRAAGAQRAAQPPQPRPLTCVSNRIGFTTITNCY